MSNQHSITKIIIKRDNSILFTHSEPQLLFIRYILEDFHWQDMSTHSHLPGLNEDYPTSLHQNTVLLETHKWKQYTGITFSHSVGNQIIEWTPWERQAKFAAINK